MKTILALLVVLLCSVPARAAVTFDANATADCTSNGVSTKDCATLTVGSGSNRALVCQVVWSGTNGGVSVANWDQLGTPQALTAITGATATNTTVAQLWGLINPTSGAKTVRFTWTTARDVIINCVSWTGVNQTGGATSFPNGTGASVTSSGLAAQTIVTVTSATGNATMAVLGTTGTPSGPTQTQTFLDATPATMSGAGARAAGAASVVFGWQIVSNGLPVAAAGTDIAAAGGGGGVVCGARALIGVGC